MMTIDQMIEVLQAVKALKKIQTKGCEGNWIDYDPIYSPVFNFGVSDYRIKPKPKFRPWKAEEVPVGAIVRYKGNSQSIRLLIVSSFEPRLLGSESHWTYSDFLNSMEYSINYGATWLPCGVLEDKP